MPSNDLFNLDRFLAAQSGGVFEDALAEIRAGRKRSHWMWFIFPQIAGLGSSPMAQEYAIKSLDETRAYLAHPVLGERLRQCAQAVMEVQGKEAEDIFGNIDSMKLRSSMTLFAQASPDASVFERVIEKYYEGKNDEMTLRLLGRRG